MRKGRKATPWSPLPCSPEATGPQDVMGFWGLGARWEEGVIKPGENCHTEAQSPFYIFHWLHKEESVEFSSFLPSFRKLAFA